MTINDALAARHMTPQRFKCECCGDTYDADEVMPSNEWGKTHMDAIRTRFGRNVCQYCGVDMRFCEMTDAAITEEEAVYDDDGLAFASKEARDAYAREQADLADDRAYEMRRYRESTGFPFGGV